LIQDASIIRLMYIIQWCYYP